VVRGLLGIRRSSCALIFDALADLGFVAIVSPAIVRELRQVLNLPSVRRRYGLTDDQVADLIDAYSRQAEAVAGAVALPSKFRTAAGAASQSGLVPAEDVPIVATALEGGAEHLVTDDSDLLDVKMLNVPGFVVLQMTAPGPFAKHVLRRVPDREPQT
jgi:predicted nucleic acid-binding protein